MFYTLSIAKGNSKEDKQLVCEMVCKDKLLPVTVDVKSTLPFLYNHLCTVSCNMDKLWFISRTLNKRIS
jgi:hypothetical protein